MNTHYSAALKDVMESEFFKDCITDGKEVTAVSITEDMVFICKTLQRMLTRLASIAGNTEDWEIFEEEGISEFATNARILYGLSEARAKLAIALDKDSLEVAQ